MSLTDRIRPGVEAAPWVVAEIKKREEVTAALIAEIDRLKAENAKLRETITAIRAVNVDEHGQVADAAIERLIASPILNEHREENSTPH